MKRGIAALSACGTLALLAGCGSSSKPSPTAATAPSGTTSTTTTPAATTPAATTPTSSLKVSTRPKFGTPPSTAPVQSGTVEIAYRNIAINPDTVRVKSGSTIRWTNYDSVEHNVTSDGGPQRFDSKNFGEGATFELKVTRPGIIHYLCTIHPASMNGAIQVVK